MCYYSTGTHAYLSMAIHYIEPGLHHVPIVITNNGTDPQSKYMQLKGNGM